MLALTIVSCSSVSVKSDALPWADQIPVERGIVACLGLQPQDVDAVVELVGTAEWTLYVQSSDSEIVAALQRRAAERNLLGRRIFVGLGADDEIQLADNVADVIVVAAGSQGFTEHEVLRAVRPGGMALLGDRQIQKPEPAGTDQWTHPYHGPDNNPQSDDQLLRGALKTQFLAEPLFSPMPEQTVVAGGRIFKAMGHIAHKENQNAWLNTLVCINAYNGTILWQRSLPEGFMLHRNTMVATDDALLIGDAESCKVIDAVTGDVRHEITVDEEISDGPVWKWMAVRDDVLYALVGNREITVDTMRSARRGLGHWPWDVWKGHDYKDPRTSFGFGRTLLAIDLKTNKRLWHYRDEEFLDARGVCMNDNQIFCYSPERFLLSISRESGQVQWKNNDPELLEAIGTNGPAQHYVTGYATTCYIKCNNDYVFFAGPQRKTMVVASAKYGSLAWTHPHGNLQLVLRTDGIYAAGPEATGTRLEYSTGKILNELPTRRACTRATGCADSVFYRTTGGTVRVMSETATAEHIAPMRPPCQDGVVIAHGHAYWGPWMCGCQLSLYGHIALAPAGDRPAASSQPAHWSASNAHDVTSFAISKEDWPTYRANNARSDVWSGSVPEAVSESWTRSVVDGALPTGPVAAGDLVVVADRSGAVTAFDQQGELRWKSFAAGAIYYPPAVAEGRVVVGADDGAVYAFEAASGRLLWRYRVAPTTERIPVYGKLVNRWPVAGEVVVRDGIVYAAAGIAHYDGTYVVSLKLASGQLVAENRDSGRLAPDVNGGVSLQGELSIVDDQLHFLAGGVYETARFDLKALQCLNPPKNQVTSQFRTAFYPWYPEYGKYLSLEYVRSDGTTLVHDASYEGSEFSNLALQEPLPSDVPRDPKEAARWERRNGSSRPKLVWQDQSNRRFTAFVVTDQVLLAAGHLDGQEDQPFLAAIDTKTGNDRWLVKLPSLPVKGGVAIDRDRQIYVALENGKLFCLAP
jgi:outer membrane protein assembly factor BamB